MLNKKPGELWLNQNPKAATQASCTEANIVSGRQKLGGSGCEFNRAALLTESLIQFLYFQTDQCWREICFNRFILQNTLNTIQKLWIKLLVQSAFGNLTVIQFGQSGQFLDRFWKLGQLFLNVPGRLWHRRYWS